MTNEEIRAMLDKVAPATKLLPLHELEKGLKSIWRHPLNGDECEWLGTALAMVSLAYTIMEAAPGEKDIRIQDVMQRLVADFAGLHVDKRPDARRRIFKALAMAARVYATEIVEAVDDVLEETGR